MTLFKYTLSPESRNEICSELTSSPSPSLSPSLLTSLTEFTSSCLLDEQFFSVLPITLSRAFCFSLFPLHLLYLYSEWLGCDGVCMLAFCSFELFFLPPYQRQPELEALRFWVVRPFVHSAVSSSIHFCQTNISGMPFRISLFSRKIKLDLWMDSFYFSYQRLKIKVWGFWPCEHNIPVTPWGNPFKFSRRVHTYSIVKWFDFDYFRSKVITISNVKNRLGFG